MAVVAEKKTPVTVAYGDGIGPEIMDATLRIVDAAGALLEIERIEIGKSIYDRGLQSGIEPGSWESLRRTKVFLKAPITTPQGGGFKSLNVTVRKTLGMYANVRPCAALDPYVATKNPGMNLVIVRENEEGVYGGIEHRQTQDVVQCLKLISRPGSERVVRYAFEYARAHARRKVTCFTKDNIMKQTDGLFHAIFDEIAKEYPEVENEHWIVDIGAAKMVDTPRAFDVLVMPNLYGDVLSDVAAQMTGSVGLAGSANIGDHCSMFEAIHGSAPRRAGQNLANPSGLLHGALLMLSHIGQGDVAQRIHNAWLRTIEDGVHTYDVYDEHVSKQNVGTREFAEAVIARLGQEPQHLRPARYAQRAGMDLALRPLGARARKTCVGVDVFIDLPGADPDAIAKRMRALAISGAKLTVIANRGTKVWPNGDPDTFWSDHWSCRFERDGAEFNTKDAVRVVAALDAAGFDVVKTEGLYEFDGVRGYSLAQGQ
ncbi:MAG: NADP-dependent isocitrate dehydrogenase [Candidatus Tyrphobacter sp.]